MVFNCAVVFSLVASLLSASNSNNNTNNDIQTPSTRKSTSFSIDSLLAKPVQPHTPVLPVPQVERVSLPEEVIPSTSNAPDQLDEYVVAEVLDEDPLNLIRPQMPIFMQPQDINMSPYQDYIQPYGILSSAMPAPLYPAPQPQANYCYNIPEPVYITTRHDNDQHDNQTRQTRKRSQPDTARQDNLEKAKKPKAKKPKAKKPKAKKPRKEEREREQQQDIKVVETKAEAEAAIVDFLSICSELTGQDFKVNSRARTGEKLQQIIALFRYLAEKAANQTVTYSHPLHSTFSVSSQKIAFIGNLLHEFQLPKTFQARSVALLIDPDLRALGLLEPMYLSAILVHAAAMVVFLYEEVPEIEVVDGVLKIGNNYLKLNYR